MKQLSPADMHNEIIIVEEAIETIEQLCLVHEVLSDIDDIGSQTGKALSNAVKYAADRARESAELVEFTVRPEASSA